MDVCLWVHEWLWKQIKVFGTKIMTINGLQQTFFKES